MAPFVGAEDGGVVEYDHRLKVEIWTTKGASKYVPGNS